MPQHYPFTAIVGCAPDALEPMGLALVLATINAEIGGVLVRGEKGTAKSTAVRGLAAVLPPIEVYEHDRFSIDPADARASSPDGPFEVGSARLRRPVRLVELPVGATEDRVLGSIHLQSALSAGEVTYEPGLLARAHRGILYVDEVNLLHDHLVDLLLDAAAMGRSTVERDGISLSHQAKFALIGTMNPEEGELRPQLLDRFGLTVEVAAPRDSAPRSEVVRRRLRYDADPDAFTARFAGTEEELARRIEAAQRNLPQVELGDRALELVAKVCAAFEVDGLRADIVTARAAITHAAWSGRAQVTKADIRQAALLALPHRRRRNPFDAPGLDEELLDRVLNEDDWDGDDWDGDDPDDPSRPPDTDPPTVPDPAEGPDDSSTPPDGPDTATEPDSPVAGPEVTSTSSADVSPVPEPDPSTTPEPDERSHRPAAPDSDGPTSLHRAANPNPRPKLLAVRGVGRGASGRRSRAITTDGRRIGATIPTPGEPGTIHLTETLRAAAGAQPTRRQHAITRETAINRETRVQLHADDLRIAIREGREANLVLFCVDASGSMAARRRMIQVKTAILSLLLDAYRRRDTVGLVSFRANGAELVLPPTRSVDIAAARLDQIPAGGRTPLAEGLLAAARVLERERLRDARRRPLLVVVTDGRATTGPDAVARSLAAADVVAQLGVSTVVIDSESGPMRLGLARALAARLGADHLPVDEVTAQALTGAVTQMRTPQSPGPESLGKLGYHQWNQSSPVTAAG